MTSRIPRIAKFEYLKVVRKKSFWAMVLLIPILYIVIAVISGTSAESVEKKIIEEAQQAKHILVVDQAGIISDTHVTGNIERSTDPDAAREAVRTGEVDAAFIYPADFGQSRQIGVIIADTGVVSRGRFDELAKNLVKQSILERVDDPAQVELFNAQLTLDKTVYKDGAAIVTSLEAFVVPIVAVVLYFLLVMLSSSFMLMSVSEEKENRMIETILSVVRARELIWGKLLGMLGIAFTQIAILGAFGVAAYNVTTRVLPFAIQWSLVQWTIPSLLLTAFFIIAGFVVMASLMVGIGAAMPSYKDAQQAAPVFIILSILPMYFSMVLIADPAGTLSRITSYVPFMSPLVLLFRASMGALPWWEMIIGVAVTILYVVIGLYLAFKLFEIGSLELGKKISFRSAFRK